MEEGIAFRESRLKKIREAREVLGAEARQEADQERGKGKQTTGTSSDKAQRNFTDPESHIMPAPGGKHFEQAYNAQAAVDSAHQVIVAADLTNEPSDKKQAKPMMELVRENTGKLPEQMSADAGYYSGEVVQCLTSEGIDVYLPPDRMKHSSTMAQSPRGRIPKELSTADRMRRKLRTKKGRKCYGLRKELPEPVFGQIKQGRGFWQFLLRGREKVKAKWRLICTGHNVLKLFGAWRQGLVGPEVLGGRVVT